MTTIFERIGLTGDERGYPGAPLTLRETVEILRAIEDAYGLGTEGSETTRDFLGALEELRHELTKGDS